MLHADGLGTAGVRAVIRRYPLSSPPQERATTRHPRRPGAGWEVASDREAPVTSQSRNIRRTPRDGHRPGASRRCQGTRGEQRCCLV